MKKTKHKPDTKASIVKSMTESGAGEIVKKDAAFLKNLRNGHKKK